MEDLILNTDIDLYEYLSDKKHYKIVRKKQYIVWCCQPKVGVKVNGQVIEKGQFVIQGILGEKRIVNFATLKNNFVQITGADITKEFILKKKQGKHSIEWFQLKTKIDKAMQWGVFIPKNYKFSIPRYSLYVRERVNEDNKYIAVVDNQTKQIKLKDANNRVIVLKNGIQELMHNFVFFDGKEITEESFKKRVISIKLDINTKEVERSKGDFILCGSVNGRPLIFEEIRVINGELFALTYNLRGWTDKVDENIEQDLTEPNSIINGDTVSDAEDEYVGYWDNVGNVVEKENKDIVEDSIEENEDENKDIVEDSTEDDDDDYWDNIGSSTEDKTDNNEKDFVENSIEDESDKIDNGEENDEYWDNIGDSVEDNTEDKVDNDEEDFIEGSSEDDSDVVEDSTEDSAEDSAEEIEDISSEDTNEINIKDNTDNIDLNKVVSETDKNEDILQEKQEEVNSNENIAEEQEESNTTDDVTKGHKINDFGEKIGGAKKDLWKMRGLSLEDIATMTKAERKKYITKENIWIKPDYEKLVQDGLDIKVAFFRKVVRDACPAKVNDYTYNFKQFNNDVELEEYEDISEEERYIRFIQTIKEIVESMDVILDVRDRLQLLEDKKLIESAQGYRIKPTIKSGAYLTKRLFRAYQISLREIDKGIVAKKFCYNEDEKLLSYFSIFYIGDNAELIKDNGKDVLQYKMSAFSTRYFYSTEDMNIAEIKHNTYMLVFKDTNRVIKINFASKEEAEIYAKGLGKAYEIADKELKEEKKKGRKNMLVPPMLEHIERIGEDIRGGKDIIEKDIQDTFKFKGGEFGNWLNDKERQASLNYSYEAFMDLADVLGIKSESISLNSQLSIAFGARGSGNALAHYEPLREVINLTKMRGAGSLAHEWIHALDNILGLQLKVQGFMSDNYTNVRVPKSLDLLMTTIMYKEMDNKDYKKQCMEEADIYIKKFKDLVLKVTNKVVDDNNRKAIEDAINAVVRETMLYQDDKGYTIYRAAFKNSLYNIDERISSKYVELIKVLKENGKELTRCERTEIGQAQNDLSRAYQKLKEANKGVTTKIFTNYYKDARAIDGISSKAKHGYWASNVELLARAGAAYIKDKLAEQGRKNDYLCGHADMPPVEINGEKHYISPQGEERKAINDAFDVFIQELKSKNLL